ncbi:hypothetical protein O6H91_16G092800 [Diphasiastrum complanatum]|nr:hypothetical protein O6H91_16G092800 [Diphasiastrum complanatum]
MGTLIGHVAPGIGFILIGLWHLINTIRGYVESPWNFESRPWFPTKARGKWKYIELYLIMFGSSLSIASELFIGPERHQPLADDWSIPPEHLNNFEHSSISLFFLIYASVALWTSICKIEIPDGLLHVLASLVFSQELLLFHLHSADHMGVEGQYHWLLQIVVFVCLVCTLLEVAFPHSFLLALMRSTAILFQGLWFVQMGLVLWIPAFVPKGCKMHPEDEHNVVRCGDSMSRMRAKALANLQFNWYLAGLLIFTLLLYTFMLQSQKKSTSQYLPADRKDETDFSERENASKHRSHSKNDSQSSMEMEAFCTAVQFGR